jgi:hypothetical protein
LRKGNTAIDFSSCPCDLNSFGTKRIPEIINARAMSDPAINVVFFLLSGTENDLKVFFDAPSGFCSGWLIAEMISFTEFATLLI